MIGFTGLIFVGLVLLLIGVFVKAASVLFTIGLILLIVGVVWWLFTLFTNRA